LGIHAPEGGPDPQVPVGNGQLRRAQPPGLQIAKEGAPAQLARDSR
jgi:hypothetical protein